MTTLSASLDIIDLSDGVLTKSAEGQRTIVTEDAAPLPLLTLAPIIGESVQDGTPTPDTPVMIRCVRGRNLATESDGVYSITKTADSAAPITTHPLSDIGKMECVSGVFVAISFDAKVSSGMHPVRPYITNASDAQIHTSGNACNATTEWQRFISVLTLNASNAVFWRIVANTDTDSSGVTYYVRNVMIEVVASSTGIEKYVHKFVPFGHIPVISTGKNTINSSEVQVVDMNNGITWTRNADGSVSASGTASADAQYRICVPMHIYGDMVMSGSPIDSSSDKYSIYAWDLTTNARCKKHNGTTAVTDDTGSGSEVQLVRGHFNIIICRVKSGKTVNITFYPQLEYGSDKTEYETYRESVSYIDLKGNELHGLDTTYYDQLDIDASGHAILMKRTDSLTLDNLTEYVSAGSYKSLRASVPNWYSAGASVVTLARSNYFGPNQWSGSWYPDKIFADVQNNRVYFTFDSSFAADLTTAKSKLFGFLCVYPLIESAWHTIDLGYVDLPQVTDGATVYVAAEVQPVIGGSWWTQAGLAAGEAFKDNRDEDWASRLMVTNAQMAIDKINGQIQTLVSGLDGMTTLTQTDSGFEFTVDDSLTSLLNGLQTDYNSLIHDLGVVVGNHTTELGVLNNYVQVTTENNQPVLRLGSSTNPVVAVLTNTGLEFRQSENGTESVIAYLVIDDDGRGKLKVNTAVVLDTLQFGNWEWYTRPNGNMSIRWIGE